MDYIDDEESDQFFRIIGEICRINERGRKMTNIEHYASRSVSDRRVKRFKKKLAKEDKEELFFGLQLLEQLLHLC